MMKHVTQLILLAFFFVLPCVVDAEENDAEVFLETHRSEFQKIPIWIMGFADGETRQQDGAGIGEQVNAILKADLRRTQVFEVLERSTDMLPLSKAGCREKIPIEKARESAAPVVTWGKIGRQDGKLLIEACAHDGGETDVIAVGKRYAGAPITIRLLRSMVHRWADELVAHYTGDPGIAQTRIIYVSEDKAGRRDLFMMDYDGFGPKRVTSDPKLSLMPNWSPDRRSVVYTTYRQNNQEIVWFELGKKKKRILVSPETLNITPTVSPNGRLLAYASAKDSATQGNSDIFIMNLSTEITKQLTDHRSAELSPTWSPDGRELAFTSDRSGRPQIYIMKADGSHVRRLTWKGRHNAAPAWSPRGDWIAYVCRIPGYGLKLCRISPDGKRRVRITSGPPSEIDDSPSWAPNGRHLVFSSTRGKQSGRRNHIYMIHFDGAGLEQLTKGGIHHSSPAWSPGPE
ncbi:MAG: hypothetical protein OXB94_09915 [Nitrospira sp.]|nr:hypothetical protein [Nitrospira sp.]